MAAVLAGNERHSDHLQSAMDEGEIVEEERSVFFGETPKSSVVKGVA
jgi:hypothetical protein